MHPASSRRAERGPISRVRDSSRSPPRLRYRSPAAFARLAQQARPASLPMEESHVAAFGAMLDGTLVGSCFATNWGSVGVLGPLTVRPDLQERGIGQALLASTTA